MSRPTDPDQLAIALGELARDVRGLPNYDPHDVEAVAGDIAATLDRLAERCREEADRPPAERIRDLAAQHVPDHGRMVHASS